MHNKKSTNNENNEKAKICICVLCNIDYKMQKNTTCILEMMTHVLYTFVLTP